MNDALARLYRRITMMVGIGRTTGVSDDRGTTQTLQYKTPFDVRGDTLRMTEFGFSSGLPAGSDVLILSLGGDRSARLSSRPTTVQRDMARLTPERRLFMTQRENPYCSGWKN